MNQEGQVTIERQGHILLIGLDRVAKRNAFDRAMLNALALAYAELERNDNLRCGVLFAHGDHFTGGLELTQFVSSLGHFEYPEGALDPLGIQGARLTQTRAGKPWSFLPGMNRRACEGGGEGRDPGEAARGGLDGA